MPSLRNTAEPLGYILCTSPRSGSTLLCAMLKAAGAGVPESLFYDTEASGWAKRLGMSGDANDPTFLRSLFAAGIAEGQGGTAVFGVRQQRRSFDALTRALAIAYPEAETDPERLSAAFGPHALIYLTRADKLAQAVSLLRAEATGLWHLGADGAEIERNSSRREDLFDAGAIADTIKLLESYDEGWQSWFASHQLAPLTITYEALAAGPKVQLARVLAHLGLPEDRAQDIDVPLAKLADHVTEDWIARFNASPHAQMV